MKFYHVYEGECIMQMETNLGFFRSAKKAYEYAVNLNEGCGNRLPTYAEFKRELDKWEIEAIGFVTVEVREFED